MSVCPVGCDLDRACCKSLLCLDRAHGAARWRHIVTEQPTGLRELWDEAREFYGITLVFPDALTLVNEALEAGIDPVEHLVTSSGHRLVDTMGYVGHPEACAVRFPPDLKAAWRAWSQEA